MTNAWEEFPYRQAIQFIQLLSSFTHHAIYWNLQTQMMSHGVPASVVTTSVSLRKAELVYSRFLIFASFLPFTEWRNQEWRSTARPVKNENAQRSILSWYLIYLKLGLLETVKIHYCNAVYSDIAKRFGIEILRARSTFPFRQTECASISRLGYYSRKVQTGDWGYTFLKSPPSPSPGNFRFVT